MVRSAEQQIAELAEQLGLPPSAAPTAGAAAAAAVRDTSPAVSQPQVAAAAAAAAAVDKPQRAGPSKDGQQPVAQQSKQQQEKQETPGEAAAGAQPAPPPQQQAQQVEVVAASGRVLLKRDRSKQYTPTNKRHEGLQEAGEQPQSSDSSMQASQGDPNQQQHSDSGASRPRGGGSIMQRTRAALQLWKALRVRCPAAAVLAMLGLLLLLLSTPAAGAFCCMHAWGWAGLLTHPCCRASQPPNHPPRHPCCAAVQCLHTLNSAWQASRGASLKS